VDIIKAILPEAKVWLSRRRRERFFERDLQQTLRVARAFPNARFQAVANRHQRFQLGDDARLFG